MATKNNVKAEQTETPGTLVRHALAVSPALAASPATVIAQSLAVMRAVSASPALLSNPSLAISRALTGNEQLSEADINASTGVGGMSAIDSFIASKLLGPEQLKSLEPADLMDIKQKLVNEINSRTGGGGASSDAAGSKPGTKGGKK